MKIAWMGWVLGATLLFPAAQETRRWVTAENYEAVRDLLKPQYKYGESEQLYDLPWLLDLGEALRKGAAEGKPILVVWADHENPLIVRGGKALEAISRFFNQRENWELVNRRCIPVAVNWALCAPRGDDPAVALFDKALSPKDPFGKEGWWIALVSPSGKLLGHCWPPCPSGSAGGTPLAKALEEVWGKLPEAERKQAALKGEDACPPLVPPAPRGMLSLKAFGRVLRRKADGGLEKLGQRQMDASGVDDDVQRDFLWLTEAEWKSLVPAVLEKGAKVKAAPAIRDRLFRYHLIDVHRGGGAWERKDIRAGEVTLTVEEATAVEAKLRIEGWAQIATDPDLKAAPAGYEGGLWGYATYDRQAKAFKRFELVTLGENWSDGEVRYPIIEPPKRLTMGRVFERVPPDSYLMRIRPRHCSRADEEADYFGP